MYFSVDGTNLRLAGSIHLFPAESPGMPAWILRAYEWCEELVFEHNAQSVIPLMRLADNLKLSNYLPPDILEQLSPLWRADNPLGPLLSLKPWAVMIGLVAYLAKVVPGVEFILGERATGESKPIGYLETSTEFAQRLDVIPNDLVIENLAFIVSNCGQMHNRICDMHTAWLDRNLDRLLTVASQAPLWRSPVLREVVIASRNRAWISRIHSLTRSCSRTLIVVGALHLCGDGNLIELYEQQGLKISQVPSSD